METTALNTGLTFGSPLWLWALLLVPALGALFLWAQSRRRALISRIVAPRLREQLAAGVSPLLRGLRAVLVLLALALLLVALAKPRMGTIRREIKSNGRDVLLAIDTSRSMLATDVAPTRLARAKLISEDLINLLQGDRIGVVAFAGSAFLQAPLTLDYNAVRTTLDELDTEVIPRGGTDIAAAIDTAITAFGKAEGVQRALVVMTDGEDLDGNAVDAAKKAAAQGIRIFTIGLGSPQGSLIPIRTEDGRNDYVRDQEGKPVQSRLDEKRLAEIAKATGGFYSPLTPDVARRIYDKGIEPMATSDTGMLSTRQPIEQYQWPLGGALLCLVLWILLGEGRARFAIGRRGARATAAAGAIVVLAMNTSRAAESGLQQYQKGDYKGALSTFEQNATVTPEKEKAQFDAGAAAYKSGDYAKAITHFTSALLSDDDSLRAQASYNLGNSLVRRGEKAKATETKEKDWKDAITHYDETLKLHPNDADAKANRDIVKKLLEDLKKKQEQQKQQQQQNQQNKNDQQKQSQQQQNSQNQQNQQQNQNKDQQQKQDQQKNQQQQGGSQQQQDQQKQDQQNKQDQKNQQGQPQNKDQQQKQDEQKNQQQQGGSQQQQKNDQNKDQQQKGSQGQQNKQDQNQQQPQSGSDQQKKPESQNGGQPQNSQDQQGQQPQENQPQPGQGNQPQPTPQPTPGEKKQGELKAQPDQQKQGEGQQQQAVPAKPEKDGEMSEAQARALLRSMQGEEQRVRLLERQQNQDVIKDW
jgi:Ca-activated chloride channel family protein